MSHDANGALLNVSRPHYVNGALVDHTNLDVYLRKLDELGCIPYDGMTEKNNKKRFTLGYTGGWGGGFLSFYDYDCGTGEWRVTIDPDMYDVRAGDVANNLAGSYAADFSSDTDDPPCHDNNSTGHDTDSTDTESSNGNSGLVVLGTRDINELLELGMYYGIAGPNRNPDTDFLSL